MNLTTTQKLTRFSRHLCQDINLKTAAVSMLMVIAALLAFEVFNFSSTSFALQNILGSQSSGGMSWSTILALAFCGMDFAGIARLLGPKSDSNERGGWYLLGAWVLAAAMNTGLTWWSVSLAVYNQPVDYALIINPMTFVTVVPVLVAILVWVIRVLIIGSLVSAINETISTQPAGNQKKEKPAFGFHSKKPVTPPGYQPVHHPARAQQS